MIWLHVTCRTDAILSLAEKKSEMAVVKLAPKLLALSIVAIGEIVVCAYQSGRQYLGLPMACV